MSELLNSGVDIKKLLNLLTEEEKKQAFALLQGMIIGKELEKQQKETA